MVHRQQPHLCLICGKSYRQASGLMIHTKTAHGDQETYLMVDNPTEDLTQEDEQTAVLFVNNIKLVGSSVELQPISTTYSISSLKFCYKFTAIEFLLNFRTEAFWKIRCSTSFETLQSWTSDERNIKIGIQRAIYVRVTFILYWQFYS